MFLFYKRLDVENMDLYTYIDISFNNFKIFLMILFKKFIRTSLLFSILSFAFIGTECENIINGSSAPEDLLGRWILVRQTGASQDVCDGETVEFQSSTATLKCPNQSEIVRSYTASNGILTYETGVSYEFIVRTENDTTKLDLIGRNVSRNLYYDKIVTDNDVYIYKGSSEGKTSSEPIK